MTRFAGVFHIPIRSAMVDLRPEADPDTLLTSEGREICRKPGVMRSQSAIARTECIRALARSALILQRTRESGSRPPIEEFLNSFIDKQRPFDPSIHDHLVNKIQYSQFREPHNSMNTPQPPSPVRAVF
jgi:hypothetical protein